MVAVNAQSQDAVLSGQESTSLHFNTILRVTFLFSGPTTATFQGPSSRRTPTSVLHGGSPITLNTHDGEFKATAPSQMHKVLVLLSEVNQTLKIKFGFIHTFKR